MNQSHPMLQSALNYIAEHMTSKAKAIIDYRADDGFIDATVAKETYEEMENSDVSEEGDVFGLAWYLKRMEECGV